MIVGRLKRYVLPVGCLGLLAAGILANPGSIRIQNQTNRTQRQTSKRVIPALPLSTSAKKQIEFNRDIRPIITKCFACHGHDPKQIRAGLRLDLRVGAIKKLRDGRTAIVPGDLGRSELLKRVYSKDPNELMPPPESNKILSEDEKAKLKQWIKEGAEYKEHWAFVAPVRPPLPPVKNQRWAKNPIDRFVLSKLEESGLNPSPEADKRTLIRRVSLDLTGLPPPVPEVDEFLKDRSPKAYERVVDRLLASPRYGERMAVDWMDYARYADSNGYQADWERYQYRWRDWVIDAFNRNMPYDQFTIEQLAGDLLPNHTLDQVIATGFNRNHRINTEGGVIPEEWRIETIIDRVETTSETWLGLTAGCARCHDHKYDPISQRDFYSMVAYFNNVPESGSGVEEAVNHPPFVKAPYPLQARQLTAIGENLVSLRTKVHLRLLANDSRYADWTPKEAPAMASLQEDKVAEFQLAPTPKIVAGAGLSSSTLKGSDPRKGGPVSAVGQPSVPLADPQVVGPLKTSVGRATGAVQTNDKSYIDLGDVGDFDIHDRFSVALWINPDMGSGSALARMDTKNNFRGWDVFLEGGKPTVHIINNWPEDALKVDSKTMIPYGQWSHVTITYDGSAKLAGVKIYVDGKPAETYADVDKLKGSIRNKVHLRVGRRTDSDFFNGQVDDPMIYSRVLTAAEAARIADVHPARPLLAVPKEKRTKAENTLLDHLWSRDNDPEYKALDDERIKADGEREKLDKQITTVMVMQEMLKPRDCYVLIRGQYDHRGDKVTAAVPKALSPLPEGAPSNRLGLAQWIVSPTNPLTARVAVNRLWERLFGTGIVATSEDFGTRSEFPSHPELLDWLATEFVGQKWNLKAILKEMVTSATYRQSSSVSARLERVDPNNRLLARGPRFRLSAEVIRDQALAAAGLLAEKIGGPSVRPYQPDGLWDEVSFYGNLHNYKHDTGPNLHRRSLYTIWKRTSAPPNMTLFDASTRETCRVARARTDTPLQALDLMNDVTYLEAARGLALRVLRQGGKDSASRLAFAFEAVLARRPTVREREILSGSLAKRLAYYEKNPDAAKKLITQGDLPNDPQFSSAEIAAYTLTASTILNLDETITKE